MKVFVYGTLKRGFCFHHLLEQGGAEYVGAFVTPPKYTMLDLGRYPAVVLNGRTPIHGEVYEVSKDCFKRLDRLEGYPDFYNRTTLHTHFGKAWMYHLNNPDTGGRVGIVLSGVWK